MNLPAIVITAALLSFSTGAKAETDCHQPLKDMLEGTLDHEREFNNSHSDMPPDAAGGCTLAKQLDAPPAFFVT